MARWYQGYRCNAKPDILVKKISYVISKYQLTKYIPLLRIEKKARSQFYLFLAIESDAKGIMPKDIQTVDTVINSPPIGSFEFNEIKTMVSGEIEIYDYARRLKYWTPTQIVEEDPFGSLESETEDSQSNEVSFLLHRLLLWLSSINEVSWEVFRNTCMVLGLDPEKNYSRSILRNLKLLGHAETSPDGKHVGVAPITICLSDFTDNNFFLAGQRDEILIQKLSVEFQPRLQSMKRAPQAFYFNGDISEIIAYLKNSGLEHFYGGRVARRLAEHLPNIEEWSQGLVTLENITPQLMIAKRFNGEVFIETPFTGIAGFYELYDIKEMDRLRYALYFDGKKWLRGDWYGLRYLAIINGSNSCPCHYDIAAGRLAIAINHRWPELYERVLVLASGRLPIYKDKWLIYSDVSRETLDLLKSKLKLDVEEK